jgi:hypothetical protein
MAARTEANEDQLIAAPAGLLQIGYSMSYVLGMVSLVDFLGFLPTQVLLVEVGPNSLTFGNR